MSESLDGGPANSLKNGSSLVHPKGSNLDSLHASTNRLSYKNSIYSGAFQESQLQAHLVPHAKQPHSRDSSVREQRLGSQRGLQLNLRSLRKSMFQHPSLSTQRELEQRLEISTHSRSNALMRGLERQLHREQQTSDLYYKQLFTAIKNINRNDPAHRTTQNAKLESERKQQLIIKIDGLQQSLNDKMMKRASLVTNENFLEDYDELRQDSGTRARVASQYTHAHERDIRVRASYKYELRDIRACYPFGIRDK